MTRKRQEQNNLSRATSDLDISPQAAEVIHKLPPQDKKIILQQLSINKSHSGPLPDGETIRIYSEVIPNGGERLMKNVEKQLDHRIEIEKIGVARSYNQSSTGQWMGFTVALLFSVFAWDLGKQGHTVTASILGSFDLVALVTVFVVGRNKK